MDTATTTQKQEAQLPQRQRASNIVRCKRHFDILNGLKKKKEERKESEDILRENQKLKADRISLVYHTNQTKKDEKSETKEKPMSNEVRKWS